MHMPTGLSLQWTNSFYFHTLMGIKMPHYISTLKYFIVRNICQKDICYIMFLKHGYKKQ